MVHCVDVSVIMNVRSQSPANKKNRQQNIYSHSNIKKYSEQAV